MVSNSEQALSRRLRGILADLPVGADIPQDESLRQALLPLERFVPQILREIHPEWERESLDGIYPYVARKTGEREVEIFGPCVLITDQTLAPLHLRFQIAASADEICWMECRLGEEGEQGMVRTPYDMILTLIKGWSKLNEMHGQYDQFNWAYQVTFGEREA